jgi:hypothetical protein
LVLEKTEAKKRWELKVSDRCDSCGAQAYVKVRGISGELMFCSHHYSNIMDSKTGYERMMGFMIEITDERERLTENRLKD